MMWLFMRAPRPGWPSSVPARLGALGAGATCESLAGYVDIGRAIAIGATDPSGMITFSPLHATSLYCVHWRF
jgi:hypothetical protein